MADYPSASELKVRKAIRELITAEQYKAVVNRLYDIALNGMHKDSIAAIKILVDRIEGQLFVSAPITKDDAPKVSREHFIGKYEGK